MRFLSRVVWSEGMYLGPHQFQAQARYFEDSVDFAISNLWSWHFGVTGYALDADALRNGTVSLIHARGIFPDGVPFHMPQSDAVPAPVPIGDHFPPTAESLAVLLALPERRLAGPNLASNLESARSRFRAETRGYSDECTGLDERPVQIGRKNFRLLFETEPADGFVTLPIAAIRRDGAGRFVFDPDFVPPCLQISASERLMVMVRRLIEILESKSVSLSRTGASGTAVAFSARDLASFWLLHAVNSALAALRHEWISKRGHPEELFLELSRLAGALCTFSLESHPSQLPAYDHHRPGPCFDSLDRHIREHLELIVPTNCLAIPLRNYDRYYYEADILDSRCFGRSSWLLGVRSPAGDAEVISKVPQLVKVCSSKFVGELVRRAMAGLALTHNPVPPPAVSARVETQYFNISKDAPFWSNIVDTKKVGIYVPGDIPNAELDLLVVLDR